jgi:hypothetical protein
MQVCIGMGMTHGWNIGMRESCEIAVQVSQNTLTPLTRGQNDDDDDPFLPSSLETTAYQPCCVLLMCAFDVCF